MGIEGESACCARRAQEAGVLHIVGRLEGAIVFLGGLGHPATAGQNSRASKSLR